MHAIKWAGINFLQVKCRDHLGVNHRGVIIWHVCVSNLHADGFYKIGSVYISFIVIKESQLNSLQEALFPFLSRKCAEVLYCSSSYVVSRLNLCTCLKCKLIAVVICRAADSNFNFKKCSEHSKEDATMLNHNKNVCFYRSIWNIIITSGRCTVKKEIGGVQCKTYN